MINYLKYAPVASVIFVITIIVSLFCMLLDRKLLESLMLRPYDFARKRKLYTIITSGLIHADMGHLIFNMLTFFFFAFYLEAATGHWQFALIYFVSMIVADIPSIIKNRNNDLYASLGASGAISAVVFSYILYNPLNKLYIMFIPIGIPAVLYAVLYLIYCVWASKKQYDNVNHSAHFWGAMSGLLLTIILDFNVINVFISRISSIF
jgi:membrane associated rhomboid family serine protease